MNLLLRLFHMHAFGISNPPFRIHGDFPGAVFTCIQEEARKIVQFKVVETLKIGIIVVYEKNCPKRSICVQIDKLASVNAKNVPQENH